MLPDPQQRTQAFHTLLDSLNAAQRAAVEHIEGPVLVIAGPGTGKTHILAARVGKILLETDARPQNILCLTFTDAGVTAMRERLLGMIGPDAHRVPVYTFHTFCNRVIQENLEYFGRSDLEPLSELERIDIIRKLLGGLPVQHPLREGRKDVFQFEAQLRFLFEDMKKERWTPGHILSRIDEFLRGLPTNSDFIYKKTTKYGQKGALKDSKVHEAQEKMKRLAAAADLYPLYQRALEKAGRYEFEDMLLWVLQAFEKNETLLRSYQERYQYFLVDEYQDTNGAQNRLLDQLLEYWPNPNVFIVGDDDQSIFEFQGARLNNLLEYYYKYRNDLQAIVLEDNYRSTQDILDAARQVVEHNRLRAIHALERPLDKRLRAMQEGSAVPVLRVYENRLQEYSDVVARIEALIAAGESPDEIAVLYARHKQANALMTLFEKKGIPYETKRPANILELPFIMQLREILQFLRDERAEAFSGDSRLFRLLHARFWKLSALDLAKIALTLRESPEPRPWRIVLAEPNLLEKAQVSDPAALRAAAALLENWLSDSFNLPLPALIEQIIRESGLLACALEQSDKLWWLQALNSFLDFVKTETLRHPRTTLERLLALLDSMDDNRLRLELQQNVRSGAGVQLLTAFAAKGLEFRHVFVPDSVAESWEPSAKTGPRRFPLPETLTLSGEEDSLEARRRLFYVAITRAKSGLNLSYSRHAEDGKSLQQARFVDETGLQASYAEPPAGQLADTQALLLMAPPGPVITLPESVRLDDLLRNYTLSVTALNRYLRCPVAFYYEDLLKIPSVMSEPATFGQAMHGALQYFFLKMKSGAAPGLDGLQQLFAAEMTRRQGYFSPLGYEQRLALGKEYLRRYHAEQIPLWRRRAVVDRRVDRSVWQGIPLSGVIDKIEWLDQGALRLIDYKTGVPAAKKVERPSEDQPHGGDYWRQLVFYKILLENARLYTEPAQTGVISWLEPDKKNIFQNVEIQFNTDDVHFVEQLIRSVYDQIQQRRFDAGCGKDDCAWCTMHRNNEASLPFSNPEEELDEV